MSTITLKISQFVTNGMACEAESLKAHCDTFHELVSDLKKEDLFIYSYLRDTLIETAEKISKMSQQNRADVVIKIKNLFEVLETRLHFLDNWSVDENETIDLIKEKTIDSAVIKPFVRKTDEEYEDFYKRQNENLKPKLANTKPSNKDKAYVPIKLAKNIAHTFRKAYAVHLVEVMIGILDRADRSSSKKRWIDIGSSVGLISNAVNVNLHAESKWDIIGCDLQQSRINMAILKASKGKKYYCRNAFDLIAELKTNDEKVDVVSMFEFCEHFPDPANLIRMVSELGVKVLVIGTPLEQKLDAPYNKEPDPAHLWGFTTKSMCSIIESHTNMRVVTSTENRVGKYNKGLDWLSVVAVRPEIKDKFDEYFQK